MAAPVTSAQEAQRRVILWCAPRSLSTAFLRAMSNVDHSMVWCEPYTSAKKFKDDPDPEQSVMAIMSRKDNSSAPAHFYSLAAGEGTSRAWVKEKLEMDYPGKKFIFVKEIIDDIDGHYYDMLPNGYHHTFLIRHPVRAFASLRKFQQDPKMCRSKRVQEGPLQTLAPDIIPSGLFYKEMCDFVDFLQKRDDRMPIILDADDVLEDPYGTMKLYCQNIGIPFTDDIVTWSKQKKETLFDNWMAPKEVMYIFESTELHKNSVGGGSSGFGKPKELPSRSEIPSDVLQAADDSMKYYLKLHKHRLVARS
ncbi:uncharacterized protein [Amphiura filiformis]|uniref:uncharacterized protein n=1 Tax=Amphiura filiformis TaxID=82378 RepID=UPI003B2221AA